MTHSFPSLPVPPDTYPAEWKLDDVNMAGEAELLAGRSPGAELFGEPSGLKAQERTFPEHLDVGSLIGRLRTGLAGSYEPLGWM